MYKVVAFFEGYEEYRTFGIYDTLEDAHDAIDREGCEWVACYEGDEDYLVFCDGQLIERWY